MSPKKRPTVRKNSSVGKKPSPKKMSSPVRTPTTGNKKKKDTSEKSTTTAQSVSALSASKAPATSQAPGNKSQLTTPSTGIPTKSPRSNERYIFRNVTPVAYKITGQKNVPKTPLRTPSGKLYRTPLVPRTPFRTPGKGGLPTIHTPFKTPRLKSITLEEQIPDRSEAFKKHKEEAVTWNEHLRLLSSRFHKICYLSTTRNFKYSNKNLRKSYQKTIENRVLNVHPSTQITASITTSSCLSLKPNSVDAVRIEVTSLRLGETQMEDEIISIYNAWMFKTAYVQSQGDPTREWFPVMLYTGKEDIHNVIVDWFSSSFDCYISKYAISQRDLLFIAGVWTGRKCRSHGYKKNDDHKVDLVYIIHPPHGSVSFPLPNQRGRPKLMLSMDLKDINHIWESIVDISKDSVTEDELMEYFTSMESIAEKLLCIPKFLLSLHQFQTPCINLKSDGRIRIPCNKSIHSLVKKLIYFYIRSTVVTANETPENTIVMDSNDSTATDR